MSRSSGVPNLTVALTPRSLRQALKNDFLLEDEPPEDEVNKKKKSDAAAASSVRSSDRASSCLLDVVSSHRYRACIDECIERCELLGLMTSEALRRRKEPQASNRNRKDIYTLMRREQDLEKKYEELMEYRVQLRGLSNKSRYLANQAELYEVTQALKQSAHNITANLKDQPTIMGNLNKIQKDRYLLQELLKDTSNSLRFDNSYDVLLEQVEKKSEEQRLLSETKIRQEKTAEALKKLEKELEMEWIEFEKLEEHKNNEIIELTKQLKHLKKVTGLTVKYEQQTAIARAETLDRERQNRLNYLKNEILNLKYNTKIDKRVHKKSIGFLTKQKDEMDELYDEWEKKYHLDYTNKSQLYEQMSSDRHRDQVELVSKQTRWEADKSNKLSLMAEMNSRIAQEQAYRDMMERMYRAQCTIRFYWRVYWRKRKKELKRLRKKRLARLRAKKKAEKNRFVPTFAKKAKPGDAAADGGATSGNETDNKTPRSKSASKNNSVPPSARGTARSNASEEPEKAEE